MKHLQLEYHAMRLFAGQMMRGAVVRRTSTKLVLRDASVKGAINLANSLPCVLDAPSGNVLTMTSGRPVAPHLNAIYSLDDDIAVRFAADAVFIRGQDVRFSGEHCEVEVFPHYYRKTFNPFFRRFNKKQFSHPPVGWLSWYCFFCDFDEEKTQRIADFAAANFKEYGLEYVLMECWQNNSDRLPVKDYYHNLEPDPRKFPNGLRHVTDMLHGKGLKAGLWIVPLGTGERAFLDRNRGMHIINGKGKPLDNWSGWHILDPTHAGARRYIARTIRTFVKDWKFDYLKIDGLEGGEDYSREFFDRPAVQKLLSRKQRDPFRSIVELMRRSMGKKTFFLACGADIDGKSRCPGLVDGARIGGDVFFDGEYPAWGAVIHTAKTTTQAYHLHNIAWYNDPDVLCVRKPLSLEHARMLCTIVGLTGQVLFLGDILYDLPAERVRMLQRLMPVCDTYPAHLAKNKALQPIWNLVIRRRFEQWNVVALFNWNENRDVILKVKPADLGLSQDSDYLMYDFWHRKFVGVLRRQKKIKIKRQSCRLVAIREQKEHPQLLSIDRHITQGGVCIRQMTWDESDLSLSSVMDLPRRESFTATLYVPPEFEIKSVVGKAQSNERTRNIVKLRVKNGRWKCAFSRQRQ